eukprot:6211099-Pleurochrysis_carterae.AAC.3
MHELNCFETQAVGYPLPNSSLPLWAETAVPRCEASRAQRGRPGRPVAKLPRAFGFGLPLRWALLLCGCPAVCGFLPRVYVVRVECAPHRTHATQSRQSRFHLSAAPAASRANR